jgi:hypothetical protein
MRIIQPARVQDVLAAYLELWGGELERHKPVIYSLHEQMRKAGFLIDVRRGTYVLSQRGMEVASTLVKEREADNRRLFLMKQQRRLYQ